LRVVLWPIFWFLGRLAGIRTVHLYGAAAAAFALVLALAVPFWWLGTQADGAAGIFGVLLVFGAYMATSAAALVLFTALLARLAIGRIRRTLSAL